MATALTSYFNTKLGSYDSLIATATAGFSDAATALSAAAAARKTAVDALATLDREIAQLRAGAAGDNLTPADIADLAETLREKLVERRKQYAQLLDLNERVFNARLLKENFAGLQARYRALKASCAEQAASAAARGALHTVWFSTDTADTVDADKAIAATLLAEVSATPDAPADPDSEIAAQRALIAAARTRIEADVPEVLRTRARTRTAVLVDDYADRIAGQRETAEDRSVNYRAANEGDSGTLAQRWLAYTRAETDLRDDATRTGARLQRALSLLQQVSDAAPLTAAERARIADVALAADADAITTEAARDTAAAAVSAKRLDLELAIMAAVLADPTADPGTNATVQTCQSDLATLTSALATATTDHTAAFALALDTWEVAVPDRIWQALGDYDAAIAALNAIVGTNLTSTRDALNSAETQLVTALGDEESNRQALAFAGAAVTAARERTRFIEREHGARRASAVRGDA